MKWTVPQESTTERIQASLLVVHDPKMERCDLGIICWSWISSALLVFSGHLPTDAVVAVVALNWSGFCVAEGSSLIMYYCCGLATKLLMQRFSCALPLLLSTPVLAVLGVLQCRSIIPEVWYCSVIWQRIDKLIEADTPMVYWLTTGQHLMTGLMGLNPTYVICWDLLLI